MISMPRVSLAGLLMAGLGTLAGPASAQPDAGKVGLAWDPAGEVCNLNISPGSEGTLYILAYPRGIFAGGITGSEFRVTGFPADWSILSVVPNPLSVVTFGDPLGPGCNIAFPSCQQGSSGVVLLYSIRFVATSPVGETVLSVVGHTTPSFPPSACPRFFGCDDPFDYFGCSEGGTAAINDPSYCVTATEATSWSRVRSLYR